MKWTEVRHFAAATPNACNDLQVTNLGAHEQMTLVNSLILDVGSLQSRIEAVLERLETSDDHDSQMRVKAVKSFRNSLLEATTLLRREGLHPGEQGTLW